MNEAFRAELTSYFSEISNPLVKRLYALISMGQDGAYGRELFDTFFLIGIVHILVLSGAQIAPYRGLLIRGPARLLPQALQKPFVLFCLGTMAASAAWPAPLTRAVILSSTSLYLHRLSFAERSLVALLIQVAIFPEHLNKMGFYLSWLCWYVLSRVTLYIRNPLGALLAVNAVCQAIALTLFERSVALHEYFMWLIAGTLFSYLTGTLLFPVLGVLYLMAFTGALCRLLFGSSPWTWLLPPLQSFLETLGAGILVAAQAFMYNFAYDLQ